MTDGKDEVFGHYENGGPFVVGLTKREYFAAMALAGLLADSQTIRVSDGLPVTLGEVAVDHADQLIQALNAE
jgi:hypothetical protein